LLGAAAITITVLFTDLISTAFFVGILIGVVLIFLALRAHPDVNLIILNAVAMLTGLNAVLDLLYLVSNPAIGIDGIRNDAAAFSAEVAPLIPGTIWAAVWALIAILALGASIWFSVLRPMRKML
jgi:hypothetical protein